MDMFRGLFEIISLLIGVALVTLLVNPQANTTKVIDSGATGLNMLLKTVTLQSGSLGSTFRY